MDARARELICLERNEDGVMTASHDKVTNILLMWVSLSNPDTGMTDRVRMDETCVLEDFSHAISAWREYRGTRMSAADVADLKMQSASVIRAMNLAKILDSAP